MITVSKKATGDFKTIGEAIAALSDDHTAPVTIYIEDAIYEEKLFIRKKIFC